MSKEVGFSVSAKAARLIGRESIRDVGGALIELIKNAYDADAESVFVRYDIPFPYVTEGGTYDIAPTILSVEDYAEFQSYCVEGSNTIAEGMDNESLHLLLSKYNKIYIVDDGKGMDEDTLSSVWMNIGTNDKEVNGTSTKGRVKTGAKGIGRFALDKLSRYTQVFTQSENSPLLTWSLDWSLFESSQSINKVKATIDEIEGRNITTYTQNILCEDVQSLPAFKNNTGTFILLSPLRDDWFKRDFRKVNNSIKSLNPPTSSDKFKISIENVQNPELNFFTTENEIERSIYDYKININVVGKKLILKLDRNEIDTELTTVSITPYKESRELDMKEFWSREAFQNFPYRRKDFDSEVEYVYNIPEVITDFSEKEFSSLGNFNADLFFLKNTASNTPILKKFVAKSRKELLNNFSGIKIYRDEFKVRPYGDEGRFYDWLGLGPRQQKSPGAPSNNAPWRTMPYQIIGEVLISKKENPYLEDQANREGLSDSRAFDLFSEIILFSIEKFEEDRQYPLREYGVMMDVLKKQEMDEETFKLAQKVNERVQESYQGKNNSPQEVDEEFETPIITPEELEELTEKIAENSYDTEEMLKVLMSLSNSGTMASTFAHELSHIATQLSGRNEHLKMCIDYILGKDGFTGRESFNPYPLIEEYSKTDKMLSSWVKVMTNPISKREISTSEDLVGSIKRICTEWEPLLSSKYMSINILEDVNLIKINSISEMDLYLIVNNFILNSAWFLELIDGKREMEISVKSQNNEIIVSMKNNGPILHPKYRASPNQIFMPTITSKPEGEGSGLGLWILSEAAIRCGGKATVNTKISDGFQIDIVLK